MPHVIKSNTNSKWAAFTDNEKKNMQNVIFYNGGLVNTTTSLKKKNAKLFFNVGKTKIQVKKGRKQDWDKE